MRLISNRKITMYEELKKSILESDEIIMNVSFIRDSGLKLLIPELLTAKESGKNIKILTSDYMHITEPNALYRLLEISGVKIFKNDLNISFHPKTYIFKNKKNITAFVGSSNISYSALTTGVEWNYKINSENDLNGVLELLNEFENLYYNNSFDLTLEWLKDYEEKYKKNYEQNSFLEIIDPPIAPSKKIGNNLISEFLLFLEKTPMTKSYKIPLFLSIFEKLEKEKSLEDIGKYFKEFYNIEIYGKDLNNKKHDNWKNWELKKFMKLAEENPIHFLTKDEQNRKFFVYENKKIILSTELFNEIIGDEKIQEDIKNILKNRNINYFKKKCVEE